MVLIPGGKLGDRYGRRRVFLIGVIGFTVASVGVAVIGSVAGVIGDAHPAGRLRGAAPAQHDRPLRAAFPPDELNRAVGIWSASSAAAIAGAPVIGGVLVERVSWQSVFFLNVPIGIATVVCGLAVMPESRESVRQRFDSARPGAPRWRGLLPGLRRHPLRDLGMDRRPDPRVCWPPRSVLTARVHHGRTAAPELRWCRSTSSPIAPSRSA